MIFRSTWWVCLWRGHDPGQGTIQTGERDHVGRPMTCERCGREDAEMATWQYNRFCGVAARQAWDREALAPQRRSGTDLLGGPVPGSTTSPDQRRADRDIETAAGWPSGHEMIVQLREALGLFAGAMPISPQRAWEEALAEVRRLREGQR